MKNESGPISMSIRNHSRETRFSFETTKIVEGVWKVDVKQLLKEKSPTWQADILALATQAEQKIIQGGAVSTSFAPSDFKTVYHPTNGLVIAQELPWLVDLYKKEFRELVASLFNDSSLYLGEDIEHSLNMNLTKQGPYEKHPDRNPATVLTAVTTVEEGEGGELTIWKTPKDIRKKNELHAEILEKIDRWELLGHTEKRDVWTGLPLLPEDRLAVIRPEEGFAYIFNGRDHIHEVTAYKPHHLGKFRVVIPGDYYSKTVPEVVDKEFNRKIGL